MADDATVSATDIARLAGVRRAAVSNWRRRHPDFPRPVGGTPNSPAFALSEVRDWLRAQGKLRDLPSREQAWQRLRAEAGTDLRLAETLARAGDALLEIRHGRAPGRRGVPGAVAGLAAELGPVEAYEFLLDRYRETRTRRDAAAPAPLAGLMAALAGPARTVLDPACATGDLLLAARAEAGAAPPRLLGQDADPGVARLAAVRLAMRDDAADVRAGDALRADAFPDVRADAVLCDPPFHDRAWGHDELTRDPRWRYGLPPRLEPELAWVQHALARLAPGGRAVLLLPSAVAARRSGRRIRAELLRTGALRAVLSPSAALHLWVLTPPGDDVPATVLMADGADAGLAAWRAYAAAPGDAHDEPGVSRAVPIIDLLDDEVDLTPARRLSAGAAPTAERVLAARDRLHSLLGTLGDLAPGVPRTAPGTSPDSDPIAELERIGHLTVLTAGPAPGRSTRGDTAGRMLTAADVLAGRPASAEPADADRLARAEPGDVAVVAAGGRFAARVVTERGAVAGPQVVLLRPDPARLDPHFLAGVLHSGANVRAASARATGASARADVRRARVPRLPPDEQRGHGAVFARMTAFTAALHDTADVAAELAWLLADGVAAGTLRPPADIAHPGAADPP